ncbi:MAG: membrane protein insertase YidC [Bacteroidales bacterium]|nr:membrane protein insertase YidC [Bacteroidales bacterium]
MDKNTVIGIALIAALVIGYSLLKAPSKEEQLAQKRKYDSLLLVQQNEAIRQEIEQRIADSIKEVRKNVPDTVYEKELVDQYGSFSHVAEGELEFYTLENKLIKLIVSNKGGRPYSVELKNYKTFDQKPLMLFNGDSTIFGLTFFANNRYISTNDLYFVASKSENGDTSKLSMKLYADSNSYIEYIYTINPNTYMMDFDIKLHGMDEIIAQNINFIDMAWEIYVPRQEKGVKNENMYTTIYYKHLEEDVSYFNARTKKEEEEENIATKLKWIAYKQQFFSSVIIPDDYFLNADIKSKLVPIQDKYLKIFTSNMGLPYESKPNVNYSMRLYFGPNHFTTLKKYKGLELQYMAFQGKNITRWINQFVIIPIFNWLDNFIGNYGIIILLLTIIIKIGLLPLTYRSYISQAKMRVLKPQIDELSKKYPKGKEMEKQQATMALYRKVGVSPMGGCLPMLLQMPILFAMFRFFPTSIELRQESFLWATDLSTYDAILEWDKYIPVLSKIYGNHISLFTILMTVTTLLTMKMNNQTANTSTQMPGMKGMMYIMPVMFMFILNGFSAALTYYYFLTNIITFGQNLLFKRLVNDEEVLKKLHEKKGKEPKKKTNWQKRMEMAAKQRGLQSPRR